MNKAVQEFREELTGKIIQAIEKGTAPWQQPWNGREAHQNALTKRQYTGINQLALSLKSLDFDGGKDPRWLTFKQASDNGWKIKKGSKGTRVTLWKPFVDTDNERKIVAVLEKVFTVFHASQIDGIGEYIPPDINEIESHERAEKIIRDSGADIRYGGGEAFYRPSEDFVQMPPKEDFKSTENYYSTLLHELTHWTGHESRLNRIQYGGKFSKDYAFEELVAEMGSLFVVSSAGIIQTDGEFQNHASYVDSWLKHLKQDSNYIFRAAAEANKAANFLLKNEGDNNE